MPKVDLRLRDQDMTAFEDLMARLNRVEEKVSTEITGLTIEEISGVTDPANGIPGWAIMKSEAAGMSPDAIVKASAKLDAIEDALLKTKVKPKSPNDPYRGELDPDDPYPLGPQGLPVQGGPVKPPQEAINVKGEEAAFNASLSTMKPHVAAALAVHPLTPPHRRLLLRRRANPGR